jgi:hypothetical protein
MTSIGPPDLVTTEGYRVLHSVPRLTLSYWERPRVSMEKLQERMIAART